jgi:hypothetical protein
MPISATSSRALASTDFSCRRPTVVKIGVVWPVLAVGLVLCAATQIEQAADSVWLGWLWVDSTAAVHSIRDRQNQTDQRISELIRCGIEEFF